MLTDEYMHNEINNWIYLLTKVNKDIQSEDAMQKMAKFKGFIANDYSPYFNKRSQTTRLVSGLPESSRNFAWYLIR